MLAWLCWRSRLSFLRGPEQKELRHQTHCLDPTAASGWRYRHDGLQRLPDVPADGRNPGGLSVLHWVCPALDRTVSVGSDGARLVGSIPAPVYRHHYRRGNFLSVPLGVYANVNNPTAGTGADAQSTIEVTTQSGPAEIALAQHLADTGAVFYGAWWCTHCQDQKQLFGKEAAQIINYVECSQSDGQGQTPECQEAGIRGYPTWEVNGERLPGAQPLEELAQLSGYDGPMNFQNSL